MPFFLQWILSVLFYILFNQCWCTLVCLTVAISLSRHYLMCHFIVSSGHSSLAVFPARVGRHRRGAPCVRVPVWPGGRQSPLGAGGQQCQSTAYTSHILWGKASSMRYLVSFWPMVLFFYLSIVLFFMMVLLNRVGIDCYSCMKCYNPHLDWLLLMLNISYFV